MISPNYDFAKLWLRQIMILPNYDITKIMISPNNDIAKIMISPKSWFRQNHGFAQHIFRRGQDQ